MVRGRNFRCVELLLAAMPLTRRITISLVVGLLGLLLAVPSAWASHTQVAMFEEDIGVAANLPGTLHTLQTLGVGVLRYAVHWNAISPSPTPYGGQPPGFVASDPRWPGYDWTLLDELVQQAPRYGITVDFSVTGPAPAWASGRGQAPGGPLGVWRPSASEFGAFVAALGQRYSGHFVPAPGAAPLPAVRMWEIWNEPNFGPDLAPQAIDRSTVPASAVMYRALVDAAWNGLKATNHLHDTIILGNLDARGQSGRPTRGAPEGYPGNYAATKPLIFLRDLYCVDDHYHPLRGRAASERGCPTTAAASRGFVRAHPA